MLEEENMTEKYFFIIYIFTPDGRDWIETKLATMNSTFFLSKISLNLKSDWNLTEKYFIINFLTPDDQDWIEANLASMNSTFFFNSLQYFSTGHNAGLSEHSIAFK